MYETYENIWNQIELFNDKKNNVNEKIFIQMEKCHKQFDVLILACDATK